MDINPYLTSNRLLSSLVHYLTNNYGDGIWDSTTRELLDEANDHLGNPKIEWCIDEKPDYSAEMLNEH